MCVTCCGMRGRLASVAIDGTCQIVDLASGKLLLNLIHDKPLTSVALMDTDVFLGANDGAIRAVTLRDPPRQVDHHLVKENALVFQGKRISASYRAPTEGIFGGTKAILFLALLEFLQKLEKMFIVEK